MGSSSRENSSPPIPPGHTRESLLTRKFTGNYWHASPRVNFRHWAVGFNCPAPETVAGVEVFVQNARAVSIFVVDIYECAGNVASFNLEAAAPRLRFSFPARDLPIYADVQPVFFVLDLSSLEAARSYLLVIYANTSIGLGQGGNELPKEDYFHRGYFTVDPSMNLLPVTTSIAWRMVRKPD